MKKLREGWQLEHEIRDKRNKWRWRYENAEKLMKELIIEMLIILAAAVLLAVVTFRGVVQCSFRYDPQTASELEEDPSLVIYK